MNDPKYLVLAFLILTVLVLTGLSRSRKKYFDEREKEIESQIMAAEKAGVEGLMADHRRRKAQAVKAFRVLGGGLLLLGAALGVGGTGFGSVLGGGSVLLICVGLVQLYEMRKGLGDQKRRIRQAMVAHKIAKDDYS